MEDKEIEQLAVLDPKIKENNPRKINMYQKMDLLSPPQLKDK